MKTLLTCDISNGSVLEGSSVWTPPPLTFGESFVLALRLTQTVDGNKIFPNLGVQSLRASLGFVDARPVSQSWSLQVGSGPQTVDNTTIALPHSVTPDKLAAAINARTAITASYGTVKVFERYGSFILVFGTGGVQIPLQVRDNTLFPLSFGQVGAVQIDGQWQHELRLIQLPVDFTDAHDAVLPPAPTITRVQQGGASGEVTWNEIQALYVRPDFRANYALKKSFARTEYLSVEDGSDAIQAALATILGSGNVTVTDAGNFTANIEFTGDLAGQTFDLLEVLAINPPAGDLTFTLNLKSAALLTWLRSAPTVTLPLEVTLVALDLDRDGSPAIKPVLIRQDLTIQRPLNWDELAETPNVDWLRPPSPKDYIPRSASTVFTGDKSGAYPVGDGAATEFTLDHPFATDDVEIWARENHNGGRQLVAGIDFNAVIVDANSVKVTARTGAPVTNAWIAYVRAAQPIAAFADGLTITTGQVTGLDALLAALDTRVGNLETLLPSGVLSRPATTPTPVAIIVPNASVLYPNARVPATFDPSSLDTANAATLATLPRAGALLPAVHTASITGIASLPDSPAVGVVYQNTGSSPIDLPGGLGRRTRSLGVDGFAGWDGRTWYQLSHDLRNVGVFTVDATTDVGTLSNHGLGDDARVQVYSTGALPGGLSAATDYFLRDTTANTFKFAATEGGDAIDLTSAGVGPLTLLIDSTSYFPTEYEQILMPELTFEAATWQANQQFSLEFDLSVALFLATSDAQWVLAIEHGTAPGDTTPAITSANLQDIVWHPVPLLAQRLIVSALKQVRHFGCHITRAADNTITAEKLIQSAWTAADSVPASPAFVLRVRLIRFDTRNSVPTAVGYAWASLHDAKCTVG